MTPVVIRSRSVHRSARTRRPGAGLGSVGAWSAGAWSVGIGSAGVGSGSPSASPPGPGGGAVLSPGPPGRRSHPDHRKRDDDDGDAAGIRRPTRSPNRWNRLRPRNRWRRMRPSFQTSRSLKIRRPGSRLRQGSHCACGDGDAAGPTRRLRNRRSRPTRDRSRLPNRRTDRRLRARHGRCGHSTDDRSRCPTGRRCGLPHSPEFPGPTADAVRSNTSRAARRSPGRAPCRSGPSGAGRPSRRG